MEPRLIARRYLGQKELPGNKFVDDPKVEQDLGEILIKAGQKNGESWCCYFAEACYCLARPDIEEWLRKLFSANCQQTLKNFQKAGFKIVYEPVPNALMIMVKMVKGKETTSGHAGIVDTVKDKVNFESIDGNTNTAGGREGVAVMPKKRNTKPVTDGLMVKAFVIIPLVGK